MNYVFLSESSSHLNASISRSQFFIYFHSAAAGLAGLIGGNQSGGARGSANFKVEPFKDSTFKIFVVLPMEYGLFREFARFSMSFWMIICS
jgi:hypothetical protein